MLFKVLAFVTLLATSISFKTDERRLSDENNDGSNKIIYIDVSLNQTLKDNNPYLHFVNGNIEQTINLILDNDYIYHTESNVSFVGDGYYEICCSTEFVTEHLDNTILSRDNYNYICVGVSKSFNGYGYYGNKMINPGATYKTQRVWLYNTSSYFTTNDDWGSKRTTAIGYHYDNKWSVIEMSNVINTYDKKVYYYADLPIGVTSINFMATSSNNNHKYLVYENLAIEKLSYGVCYCITDVSSDDRLEITNIVVNGADAMLLSMVVEAYLTLSKDISNGAYSETIKKLFTTWFEKKSASSDDLKNTKILDYTGYNDNGNSYEGLEKNASFSVSEKWNTLCSQAGIDPKTGKSRGDSQSLLDGNTGKFFIIVGGMAIIVSLGTIGFILFRKKRKEK